MLCALPFRAGLRSAAGLSFPDPQQYLISGGRLPAGVGLLDSWLLLQQNATIRNQLF
jgi:hypothetical protein